MDVHKNLSWVGTLALCYFSRVAHRFIPLFECKKFRLCFSLGPIEGKNENFASADAHICWSGKYLM